MSVPDHHHSSGDISFDNLYQVILQCFVIILLGYIAGRTGIISRPASEGIASFISKFCLTSLLFKSLCKLQFGTVNWMFLLSVFISKSLVFILVLLITLVVKRPLNLGYAGIFSIFATQSNDFALGYPIIDALYSKTHQEYLQYIYLLAPISLVVLNPIGFTLLEIHKHRTLREDNEVSMKTAFGRVLKGVATNPFVVMSIIGVIGNFVFHGSVPGILDDVLTVLGNAYSAGALFYLGISMVGKIRSQIGLGLLLPVLLIIAKSLILPLITWEVVGWLDTSQNETTSFSMYGFLYGSIPTAPSVVLFASDYGIAQDIVTTGIVMGTFLSAPLMFVSAKMMTLMVDSNTNYRNLLHETAFDVGIVSLISCMWVMGLFIVSGKWRRIPHRFTMCFMLANTISCLGMILYHTIDDEKLEGWGHYMIIILLMVGVFSANCWTALLALVLCLLRLRSLCFVMRIHAWLLFAGFGLPVALTGLVFIFGSHHVDKEIDPSFHYGNFQTIFSLIVLALSLIISLTSIITWQRKEWHTVHSSITSQYRQFDNGDSESPESTRNMPRDPDPEIGSSNCTADCDQGADINGELNVERTKIGAAKKGKLKGASSIEDLMKGPEPEAPGTSDDNSSTGNPLMENLSERICILGTCTTEQRHVCMDRLREYAVNTSTDDNLPHEEEVRSPLEQQMEEYQSGHHLVLLLMLQLSMFFGLFLCVWKLFHDEISGIYVEIEFLDICFNYGQGFLVLAVFGFDTKLIFSPLMRRLRRLIFGVEVLKLPKLSAVDPSTMQTCQQFINYHREKCMEEIVKDSRFRFKMYKEVFTGRSLCDWLINTGLAQTREDGQKYGRCLILGRVITHINGKYHFHDASYFYKFVDSYELLPC